MFSGLTFVYTSDQDFGIWLDVSCHIPNRRIQNKLIQENCRYLAYKIRDVKRDLISTIFYARCTANTDSIV